MNRSFRAWNLILALSLSGLIAACGGSDDHAAGASDATSSAATFAKSYGGPARDQATTARPRAAGGYVFAGTFNSRGAGDGRISGTDDIGREGDFWIGALDAWGDLQWQRSYGFPSLAPPGAPRESARYTLARAAFDVERDGRRNGVWLLGRLGAEGTTDDYYVEADSDLLIARLDAADQVVWSNGYDSGPFPGYAFAYGDEQTSEGGSSYLGNMDLAAAADGGAVAAASAKATVQRDGSIEIAHGLFVLKVDAAGQRQWSIVLTTDRLDAEPVGVLVRSLPDGGAVVMHALVGVDAVHVVRIDPGPGQTASVRWRRVFDGNNEATEDLLLVDDDADGAIDGVLLATDDNYGTTFDWIEGIVRKLDIDDGTEVWQKGTGSSVHRLSSSCGVQAQTCDYVVTAQLADPGVPALIRKLAPATGNTVAEHVIQDVGSAVGHVDYLADRQLYRVRHRRTVRLLDPDLSVVQRTELHEFLGDASADADGTYVGVDVPRQQLVRFGASGTAAPPIALRTSARKVERALSVQALASGDGRSDAGFVVAGEMSVEEPFDADAAWVLRLDNAGNIAWQKQLHGFRLAYSPPLWNLPPSFGLSVGDLLRATPDGGFVLGGHETSSRHYARLVKLTPDGDIAWIGRAFTPSGHSLRAVRVVPDGGFVVAGETFTDPGGEQRSSGPPFGPWVARLDASGVVQWNFRYTGLGAAEPRVLGPIGLGMTDLRVAADSGALLAGFATPRHVADRDTHAVAAIRLDSLGNVLWSNTYPIGQSTVLGNVRVAPSDDGGFVLAASVRDSVAQASSGRFNVALIAIDADGAVRWSRLYGGLFDEIVHGIEPLADGGYLVSAQSDSVGDYSEAWLLRVGPDGRIVEGCNADRGRAAVVARALALTRESYLLPDEPDAVATPAISAVPTNAVANEPRDVAVARQCFGSAADSPVAPAAAPTLTVRLVGASTGVVTSTPSGIVCGTAGGGVCSAVYPEGSLVTLRVDIGSVSRFTAWGAGCESVSGAFGEVCLVRMTADRTIDVSFGSPPAPPPAPPVGEYRLTVTVDRLGAFVGSTDGSFACQASGAQPINTCVVSYPVGRVIDIYAEPLPASAVLFEGWAGDCASFGGQRLIRLTMNQHYNCRALFVTAP